MKYREVVAAEFRKGTDAEIAGGHPGPEIGRTCIVKNNVGDTVLLSPYADDIHPFLAETFRERAGGKLSLNLIDRAADGDRHD